MNTNKQKLMLGYLISSPDIFALCAPIIKSTYFDPEFRQTVKFLLSYHDKFNAVPSVEQVAAETNIVLKKVNITNDQIEYSCDEIETFCKQEAMVEAVLAAGDLIEKKDYGKIQSLIQQAQMVSLNKNIAVDLFDDPEGKLTQYSKDSTPYPTGWIEFDQVLDGGLHRKELLLLSANSGVGKSQICGNVAYALAKNHKLNILYISLELPVSTIFKRFTAMVTDINPRDVNLRISEAAIKLTNAKEDCGSIKFVRMPTGTRPNAIRAFLKEFKLKYGYLPDALVVDYLDCMNANENIDVGNVFAKDKLASEQLCDILHEFDMIGVTASQQTRGSLTAQELNQGHIAGGISKVNTTDIYVAIMMSDSMRAQGQVAFHFLKTRNSEGVGQVIYLAWNRNALRVENPKEKQPLTLRKKSDDNAKIPVKKSGIRSAFNV